VNTAAAAIPTARLCHHLLLHSCCCLVSHCSEQPVSGPSQLYQSSSDDRQLSTCQHSELVHLGADQDTRNLTEQPGVAVAQCCHRCKSLRELTWCEVGCLVMQPPREQREGGMGCRERVMGRCDASKSQGLWQKTMLSRSQPHPTPKTPTPNPLTWPAHPSAASHDAAD